MKTPEDLLPFVRYLADGSGQIINSYYRIPVTVEIKSDNSPVTIADKRTEEFLRESIMKEFPDHSILGEEFGETNPGAEYKWVLDPIDGTKSFISGTPLFGTLIALLQNDQPVLGAINLPILDQLLIGDNKSAALNNKVVRVRECNDISQAVLLTTDFKSYETYQSRKALDNLISKVKMVRGWGDCYGYYLLATGYADIMIDPVMSVWDTMALIPVIKGAGGIISDYKGGDPAKGTSIVAASPGIHTKVIEVLNNI